MGKKTAWIETIDENDAVGELVDAYATCGDPESGQVDHVMKIHSLNPRSMLDHERLYRTLMYGPSPLQRPQREMIAVVVSSLNNCRY
jgi:alkylhydroperoxidase family enzyme